LSGAARHAEVSDRQVRRPLTVARRVTEAVTTRGPGRV